MLVRTFCLSNSDVLICVACSMGTFRRNGFVVDFTYRFEHVKSTADYSSMYVDETLQLSYTECEFVLHRFLNLHNVVCCSQICYGFSYYNGEV